MTNSRCDSPCRNARLKVNAPKFIRPNEFQIARVRACVLSERISLSLQFRIFIRLYRWAIIIRVHLSVQAKMSSITKVPCLASGARLPMSAANSRVFNVVTRCRRKNRFQTIYAATACFFARLSFSPYSSRALLSSHWLLSKDARGRAIFSYVALYLSFPTITEIFTLRLCSSS